MKTTVTRIGLLAPYPELLDLVPEAQRDLKVEVRAVETPLDQAVRIIRELEAQGVEVLIGRGPLVTVAQRVSHVPVVSCDPTTLDLFQAFHAAREYGGPISFISFFDCDFDLQVLQAILGVEVANMVKVSNPEEAWRAIATAKSDGVRVVVGGIDTVKEAMRAGLHGVLLTTGVTTLKDAFKKAVEVVTVNRELRTQSEHFKAVVDMSSEGIVAINQDGLITVFNAAAASLLGYQVGAAVGRPAGQVIPQLKLVEVMKGCEQRVGEVLELNGSQLVVNRVPVRVGENVVGALATFQEINQLQSLEVKVRTQLHNKGLVARYTFDDIVTADPEMRQVLLMAREFARTESTILITGETGTGKEIVAQSIHRASSRRNGPFVAVNCAALPEDLLESELFGYAEGAFTGARRGGKPGLFELAHRGTIFLDEINSTSPRLQARLLRVLETREVMRVGSDRLVPLDIRVIAATSSDLHHEVESGRFRRDLLYRLNILQLHLPPLRNRPGDIPLLVRHFIDRFTTEQGQEVPEISPAGLSAFQAHTWPGNVRELKNVVQRYCVLATCRDLFSASEVEEWLLREMGVSAKSGAEQSDPEPPQLRTITVEEGTWAEMEKQLLLEFWRRYGGNRSEMARRLGLSRTTLWKKLSSLFKSSEEAVQN